MIDLDEQLAAYADYLDDAERSVTVLHPRSVTAVGGPRRGVVLVAAALVAIAGGAALVAVRNHGEPNSWSTSDGGWTVVPDPDGVFVPEPDQSARWSNSVEVVGMTATDDGFIAVGYERRGPANFGVLWHSEDGEHWDRAAPDASFGSLTADESDPGAMLFDVDEYAGTVIVGGSETLAEDRQIWLSRDLRAWVTPELPGPSDPGVVIRAVATGPDGFVVAGVDVQDTENVDTSIVWFSPDGEHWAEAELDDALGAHLYDVIAADGGWYAAGSAASQAALWRSEDGTNWVRVDVAGSPYATARYSRIWRLVEFDGGVVGFGNAGSGTDFTSDSLLPVGWAEDDGRWAATAMVADDDDRLYAGPIVSTSDGLIAFAVDLTNDGLRVVEFTSEDGSVWIRRDLDLGGARNAAAAGHGIVVAAGYAESSQIWSSDTEPDDGAEDSSGAATVWIRHDRGVSKTTGVSPSADASN